MGMGVGWVHGTGETAWEWGGRMGMVVGAWWAWEHGVYSLVPRPLSRSRGGKSGEGRGGRPRLTFANQVSLKSRVIR